MPASPNAAQHSSARCGAIGATSRTSVRIAAVAAGRWRRLLDRVDQLVELGDRLVELQPVDRFADGGNGAVELAVERGVVAARRRRRSLASRQTRWTKRAAPSIPPSDHSRSRSGGLSDSMNQRTASAPYLARIGSGSTVLRFDLDIFSTRPRTHRMAAFDSGPNRRRPCDFVGAEPAAVAGAIGLVGDHALGEQPRERFGHADLADMLQRAGPEAGVEQVQDRMLDPADILRDRQPRLGFDAVERPVARLAGEADEVPARIDEGVERVGLARARPRRTSGRRHASTSGGGRADCPGRSKTDVFGQDDRQLVARHRHRAASLAMDDRDRRAPITLARHAPVAQPVVGRALAPAGGFGAADDLGGGLVARQAVEELRVDRDSGRVLGLVADRLGRQSPALAATTRLIGS